MKNSKTQVRRKIRLLGRLIAKEVTEQDLVKIAGGSGTETCCGGHGDDCDAQPF